MDIIIVLQGLGQCLDKTTLHQLTCIASALLAMTGRVTMLGISRWTEQGGSYRTIQRFFNTAIVWSQVHWFIIRHHLLDRDSPVLLGGDETVVTKAGDQTYGLDRFFSSLYGKPVPGLAFFGLFLISIKQRCSYPVMLEQVIKQKEKTSMIKDGLTVPQPLKSAKGRPGRPKGSQNKNRREVQLSPYLLQIQQMIQTLLALLGVELKLVYCVLDGAFGHNDTFQMVRQCGLHLISKLRTDAALYLPYDGLQKKYGSRKKYGPKLDYANLSSQYLKVSTLKAGFQIDIYQMMGWHKRFADPLNVVIIVKTNIKTQARAQVILFSSDLTLAYELLLDYYGLRFQLEFNFRDAKQFWGLEDFMNVNQRPVYNAAHLAMLMVNLSQVLVRQFRQTTPTFSVLDLKAHFRGRKYLVEMLKLLPQKPEPIFIEHMFANIARIGSINAT